MKKNYIEKKLSNGLKVYFYKDKNCKKFFASYNVKYGSFGYYDKFYLKDKEYHVNPGMAHFLEHTLIEHSPFGNAIHYFMDKDLEFNGLTYPEFTSYYFLGICDYKEPLSKLIEMIDAPCFTKENVDLVKNAVCEELKNVSDSKGRIAHTNNKRNLFANFEAAFENNNVLGSVETTQNITYEETKACYEAYYNYENKFLVIGGNIDIDEMTKFLEKIFKNIPDHPNNIKEYDYKDDFNVRKEIEIIEKPTDSDFAIVTYKIKKKENENQNVLGMYYHLYNTMKFSYTTPLIDDLTKKEIVLNGLSFTCDIFKDVIAITYCTDTRDYKKLFEEIDKNLNLENLDKQDFELIKKTMVVRELKKKDYIYSCFKNFPLTLDFTKNIDDINMVKSLDFEEFKEYIGNIDFSIKTKTVITNKKTN